MSLSICSRHISRRHFRDDKAPAHLVIIVLFAHAYVLHAGKFCSFLWSAIFFFTKLRFSGIPLEFQTLWFWIRPSVLSSLIWVQTIGKSYQQPTLAGNGFKVHAKRKGGLA